MNSRSVIVGLAWVFTVGAAFLVGKGIAPSPEERAGELRRAAAGTSKADRSSAQRSARSRTSARSARGASRSAIVESMPPSEAVVALATLDDPIARSRGFLALIDKLRDDQFLDVVDAFRSLGITESRFGEYTLLLHAWAKAKPEEAIGYVIAKTSGSFARRAVMASWAADDPQASLAWLRANHEGESAHPLIAGIIRGLAPSDLNLATSLLQELPYGRTRGDALGDLLPSVREKGIDAALDWAGAITDERLRSGAVAYLLDDFADDNPAEAARFIVSLGDDPGALRATDDVATALARADLNEAINWTESLPAELRSQAAEGVVSHLASQDPDHAEAWMETLASNHTNIDEAVQRFVWRVRGNDPQRAAEWIGRIENEDSQVRTYQRVLGTWMREDPESAGAWMDSVELPENVQAMRDRAREDG